MSSPHKGESARSFKKGIDHGESRRKREATSVQLRKEKKDDSIQKRRRDATGGAASSGLDGVGSGCGCGSSTRGGSCSQVGALPDPTLKTQLDSLPEDIALLNSADAHLQLEATIRFRKLLSMERNPPIAEVIGAGVVPRLVQLLQCHEHDLLVFEAAWALTNIASGTSEHARVVIDNGTVPVFVELMRHRSVDVCEQSIWALGNLAGDSCRCRDLVLSYGALNVLVEQCKRQCQEPNPRLTLIRNATWTISNLCRGKTPPRWELIAPALPLLVQLIYWLNGDDADEELLTDCCWALSYISDSAERIEALIDSGALPHLVRLLSHEQHAVQSPALRTIGNVVAGNAAQTLAVLACSDLLSSLLALLNSPKKELRKEACWTLSNITAGSAEQVAAVEGAGIMPQLINMMIIEEYEIKKEAVYAICNACCSGGDEDVCTLARIGATAPLCDLLTIDEPSLIIVCLEGIEALLQVGERVHGAALNLHARLVDDVGGCEQIEALQLHENATIYQKASRLLELFFADEEEEDALVAPMTTATGFQFGYAAT